jgi:hypothetical protein
MNRRQLLTGVVASAPALLVPGMAKAVTGSRRPRGDEVDLRIFQYASGEHPLAISWANDPPDGHVHDQPVDHLFVDRPFEFRIEPRWTGGRTDLAVIFEVKVDADINPSDFDEDFDQGNGFSNQWSQLTHLGPQTRNREMAQIGQHVTLGRGNLLHPMPDFPILWHFRVDFQLGAQNGPKRVGEGRVLVERA